MNTATIKKELDQTTRRLDELTEMRAGLNAGVEKLQQSFIDGKAPLDAVQAERAKLDTLNSSIRALETRQEELRSAYQKASLTDSHRSTLQNLKTAAAEAEQLFAEYAEMRTTFGATIQAQAEELAARLLAFRDKQREFMRTFGKIAPGIVNFRMIPREVREAHDQTVAELEALGVASQTFRLATIPDLTLSPLEYEQEVNLAQGRAWYKQSKQDQAARKAKA